MKRTMLDQLKEWFLAYTDDFCSGDKTTDTNYILKRHHTFAWL